MAVKRGEIYWVQFDPVKGSEQGGLRPALVVQNDVGNAFAPTTIVVAMTRTIPLRPYPFIIVVTPEESGLSDVGAVNCAQVATIQQTGSASRLRPAAGRDEVEPIGPLEPTAMGRVDTGLRFSLGLR